MDDQALARIEEERVALQVRVEKTQAELVQKNRELQELGTQYREAAVNYEQLQVRFDEGEVARGELEQQVKILQGYEGRISSLEEELGLKEQEVVELKASRGEESTSSQDAERKILEVKRECDGES